MTRDAHSQKLAGEMLYFTCDSPLFSKFKPPPPIAFNDVVYIRGLVLKITYAKNATFQEKYLVRSYKPSDSLASSKSIPFISLERIYILL